MNVSRSWISMPKRKAFPAGDTRYYIPIGDRGFPTTQFPSFHMALRSGLNRVAPTLQSTTYILAHRNSPYPYVFGFYRMRLNVLFCHRTASSGEVNEARWTHAYTRPCAFEERKKHEISPHSKHTTQTTAARRPQQLRGGVPRNKPHALAQARPLL